MNKTIYKNGIKRKIFLWIARILSSLSAAYFLLMVMGEASSDSGPWTFESIMVVSFVIIFVVSVSLAWWKESIGGVILTIVAIAFAVFIYITAGRYKITASVLISSPFLISGILFMITGKKIKINN